VLALAVQLATQVVGSLLALEAMDEEEDIRLYINSSGARSFVLFTQSGKLHV
jgi:ATP-dependent protease ClpP protease subunit